MTTNDEDHALDEDRILAIVAIEAMSVALDFHMIGKRVMSCAVPRNAQERHVQETGHLLAFGCCRGPPESCPHRQRTYRYMLHRTS